MGSPTFSRLAAVGSVAIYSCMAPGPHKGALHISGREGMTRFGPDATIEDVRRRLRCKCCGHRGPRIVLEVFTPGGGESRPATSPR